MIVVGMTGAAGSGKDTFANILVEKHGFTRLAFADALRQMLFDVDPMVGDDLGSPEYLHDYMTLDGAIDWDQAKRFSDARRLLQNLGVALRNIDPDFWVEIVSDKIWEASKDRDARIVVTDVRFPNEVDMIRDYYGELVHIVGRGYSLGDGANHESEQFAHDGPPGPHYTIDNSGSLEDLEAAADLFIHDIEERG